MKTQFDCALDGVLLSSLNESICVLDIREDAPAMRTAALALHPEGQHLLHQQRESLTVHAVFAIHEEDPTLRREAMQAVRAWAAKGGLLTTSDRTGLQLAVICTSLPSASSEDWTETLTLTFRSTRIPYWEDAAPTSALGSGEQTLTVPGSADFAPVDVMLINEGAEAVTSLTLHCGETQMTFEGIALEAGGIFAMIQTSGTLMAKISGQSVLACRTADSDDLLLAPCGTPCTVSASASQPLQANFAARGRYV